MVNVSDLGFILQSFQSPHICVGGFGDSAG